ncbi:MAG: hypothetical protein WCF97_06570, partial [Nitrososphaeraceae archaeon]
HLAIKSQKRRLIKRRVRNLGSDLFFSLFSFLFDFQIICNLKVMIVRTCSTTNPSQRRDEAVVAE